VKTTRCEPKAPSMQQVTLKHAKKVKAFFIIGPRQGIVEKMGHD
jgi:hypothetical protein